MVGPAPSNSSKRAFYAHARTLPPHLATFPSAPPRGLSRARRTLSFDNHSHSDLESGVFHFVMFRVIRAAGAARHTFFVHLPHRSSHVASAHPPGAARRRP